MLDFQIIEFWKWFEKSSPKLDSENFDKGLLKKLDNKIENWELTWEIGPGLTKKHSLTISPNGSINLLDKTRNIIDQAPVLAEWEFYSSKQPKENWDRAKLIDKNFEFEAKNWTYVLLKYPDDKIEIQIKAENLKSLDSHSKEIAVDLVLTNLLGEERKIHDIDFIEIVDDFDNDDETTQLKFLPDHLSQTKNGA